MRNPDDIPSPEWHNEVLSARAKRVQNGEAHFKDFDSVKSELRSEFIGCYQKPFLMQSTIK